MSPVLEILAQLSAEYSALYSYGPLGVFCGFFMWREVKRDANIDKDREALREGFETINHSVRTLSKTVLLDLAERSQPGSFVRTEARRTLDRMNSQDELSGKP